MSEEILALQQKVFDLVQASRQELQQGMVDLSPIEAAVRDYCVALQTLSVEDAASYAPALRDLSEQMHLLEDDLQRARWAVQQQLTNLSRVKTAEMAYRKTDGMGEVIPLPTDDGEDAQ